MAWCNGSLTHPLKHTRRNAAFTNCTHRPPDILFAIKQESIACLNHPGMMGIVNSIHALGPSTSFPVLSSSTNKSTIYYGITVDAPAYAMKLINYPLYVLWLNSAFQMVKFGTSIAGMCFIHSVTTKYGFRGLTRWHEVFFNQSARLCVHVVISDQEKCKLTKEEVTSDQIKCWLKSRICSLSEARGDGQQPVKCLQAGERVPYVHMKKSVLSMSVFPKRQYVCVCVCLCGSRQLVVLALEIVSRGGWGAVSSCEHLFLIETTKLVLRK